ncbi:MAG: azurin [Pseudomonadota bacterium]|nr:azurin [Pseudomonadota bacterium]
MIKKSLVAIAVLLLFAARGAYADCSFQIDVADSLGFPVSAMTAESSCGTVSVTLTHTGSLPKQAMGHNWVLTRSADFQAVAPAGMSAGVAGNYVPAGDARVIANTKLIGGGESDTVEFSLDGLAPGDYTFYCSFPGHWSAMKGTFTITAS